MSNLGTTFVEMVRRAAIAFYYFCDRCNRETGWRLVDEDSRTEFYACSECGNKRGWTVR